MADGKTAEHNSDTIPAANDTIEIFFSQSGTDVSANPFVWYLDLQKPAKDIFVKVDKISQVTEINGVALKKPINIAANGSFAHSAKWGTYHKYIQIKIKILNATTFVEVGGFC